MAVLDTERERVLVLQAPVARLLRTRDIGADFHFRGLGPDLLGETFDIEEALDRLQRRKAAPLGERHADDLNLVYCRGVGLLRMTSASDNYVLELTEKNF